MSAIACPFCGAAMNKPLKFCLSCGRAVRDSDMRRMGGLKSSIKAGATKKLDDQPTSSNFDLARKSYGLQRSMRQLLGTACWIIVLILLFYFAWQFVARKAPDEPVEAGDTEVKPASDPAPKASNGKKGQGPAR